MSSEEIHKLIFEVAIHLFEAIAVCSLITFGVGWHFGKQAGIQQVINDLREEQEDDGPCFCPSCRAERGEEVESEEGEEWKDN